MSWYVLQGGRSRRGESCVDGHDYTDDLPHVDSSAVEGNCSRRTFWDFRYVSKAALWGSLLDRFSLDKMEERMNNGNKK